MLEEPAAAEPSAGLAGKPAGEPRPASPIGAVTVPPWQEGVEASVLPRSYQDLLEVAVGAGRPLRRRNFEEYWRFHLAREHQLLYPGTTQGQSPGGCGHVTAALPLVGSSPAEQEAVPIMDRCRAPPCCSMSMASSIPTAP